MVSHNTYSFFLINFFFEVFDNIGFYQEYLSNIRIFLFGMGVLVAYIAKKSLRMPHPLILAWGGALGFAALAVAENIHGKDWGPIDHIIAYGVFSSFLVLGLIKHEDCGNRISTSSFMARVGDASYSLYLLHIPIMSVLCKIAVLVGMSGPLGAWVAEILIVSICTLVAMAFHTRFERPLMRAMSLRISHRFNHWSTGSKPTPNA